ncbi:MAG: hypothetical protein WKH64_10950 [Chloroflexia bacterium]
MGQTDPRVRFLARGGGYTLFLTPNEAVLTLRNPAAIEPQRGSITGARSDSGASALRIQLVGANPNARAVGTDPSRGE